MKSQRPKILLLLIALVMIIVAARTVVMNSETVQDAIIERALARQLAAAATSYGGDNLEVVFCGVGSPMGQGGAQSCIAVFAGDKFFIVDTGARSADQIARLGLPIQRLDGVLLTHFHSDHIADLGEVHLASWVRGRDAKLPVYGGPGVGQVVDGFNLSYGQDYQYRTGHHGEDLVPSKNAGLVAREIAPDSVIYDKDGLQISAITVAHAPIEPAYAYRFDYAGRSVLISGDTIKDDNLIAAAQNVDVLIHEVLQPDMVNAVIGSLNDVGQRNLARLLHDTLDYHTTPVEAAQAANQADADLLVFYHYAPVPRNALMRRMFLRGVDDVRDDGVLLATEGTHISLPTGSTAIHHN